MKTDFMRLLLMLSGLISMQLAAADSTQLLDNLKLNQRLVWVLSDVAEDLHICRDYSHYASKQHSEHKGMTAARSAFNNRLILTLTRTDQGLELASQTSNCLAQLDLIALLQSNKEQQLLELSSVENSQFLLQLLNNKTQLAKGAERQLIFALSQSPGEGITDTLLSELDKQLAAGSSNSLIEHTIFAISQTNDGDALKALVRLIKTAQVPVVQRKALFWLAHSDEAQALPIIESIINR
jgi:hypothetical protein